MDEADSVQPWQNKAFGRHMFRLEGIDPTVTVCTKTMQQAAKNNSIENDEMGLSSLSTFFNDITSLGSPMSMDGTDDGRTIYEESSVNLTELSEYGGDLANELQAKDTSDALFHDAFIDGSFRYSVDIPPSFDFDFSKDPQSLSKRKFAEDLAADDETDSVAELVFNADDEIPESSQFHLATREKRSDVQANVNMMSLHEPSETPKKRKLSKESAMMKSAVARLPSTGMTQSFNAGESAENRRQPRRRSTRARFSITSEDLSPAPSPAAEVPTSSQIDTTQYISDDELRMLETKELNKRVKTLPRTVIEHIKHRRRTLKNRGYARQCREKKVAETSTLQKSNGELEKELASQKLEVQVMMLQRDEWKKKFECLVGALSARGVRVKL